MLRRFFLGCAAAAFILPAWASDSLLIAAGAGYRKPVLELLQTFTTATGFKAEASFGNMKQVEVQAKQNTDISLLIGDRAFLEPMQLSQRFELLGTGRLVLVTSKAHALGSINDLGQSQFQRIAVPDRSKAVYGKAAFTCLQRQGLMQAVGSKLLEVATVPQVSAYLVTGEVDAGFINATEALALKDKVGSTVTIDPACHEPIELSLAVLQGRDHSPAAQAFIRFVATPQARQVMQRHGL
ncbi:MAG: molybdate ABC transporter substrate-binding protein [Acidovorax sp.]|jgi:molybdate transport system substrate-binding protein|nr:molybdate ABC transporter substrate-binding protein [Acidovorax sp.]